ncbi:MAG: penicillin-binding protein 2 [Clostridiales bacterium]|nr:penicillin-binding protein 2 [Clostridiales bacterium]
MGKRTIISFSLFCVIIFSLIIRLYVITNNGTVKAAAQNSVKTIDAGTTRGVIYDRNMIPLTASEFHMLACVLPTARAISTLKSSLSAEDFEVYYKKLSEGSLVTFVTEEPEALADCPDIATLKVYNRYSENQLAPHIIGYLSPDKKEGIYAAEKSYNDYLTENSGSLVLAYSADALGRALGGVDAEIRNINYASKAGIVLTLDCRIQRITQDALKKADYLTGAAVVLDIKSREILALASVPSFDPNDLSAALADKNAPFVNRAITNYSVGSVFKLIVAAAALESGIPTDFKYRCTGSCIKSGVKINCHDKKGHGLISMEEAFSVSCNTYFINLAEQLEKSTLIEYAEAFGFTSVFELMDGYYSDKAKMPSIAELDSDAAVANFAFGQGSLFATPLHLAACYAAAVLDGIYIVPSVYKGNVDANGDFTHYAPKNLPKKVISEDTSKILRRFLLTTVEKGGGKNAKSDYFLSGGKTATAQTGRYTENNEEILNSWFIGFYPYNKPEYVVAVIKENGISGSYDAAPVFKEICENIFKLKKNDATAN